MYFLFVSQHSNSILRLPCLYPNSYNVCMTISHQNSVVYFCKSRYNIEMAGIARTIKIFIFLFDKCYSLSSPLGKSTMMFSFQLKRTKGLKQIFSIHPNLPHLFSSLLHEELSSGHCHSRITIQSKTDWSTNYTTPEEIKSLNHIN